jgi:LacI family transcriptional regulator
MAVTLKDIAERTGVSPSVVSTVLSGRDNGTFVSDSTRRKVLQVAEMLNYTPVRSGRPRGSRRLRRQRTESFIGVWDPDYSPSTAYAVQNLQAALSRHAKEIGAEAEDDYGLRLLIAEDLPRMDALGIMGVILLSSTPLPREAAVATIPCVMLGEVKNPPRELVQIHMDNFQAGRLLGKYLWDLGHRRIGFLAPSAQERVTGQRYQGMQSLWLENGGDMTHVLPVPYDMIKTLGEREQVRRTVLGLFGPETSRQAHPTVLVCGDENVAAVVGQTLAEMGRRVPTDISLAAFTDTPRLAEALTPPLTTVRQPMALMADAAISRLYLLHDADTLEVSEPQDLSFPGELVVRSSCAAPAQS